MASSGIVDLAEHRQKRKPLYFNRPELNLLLALYSRRVMNGEWRDYAIDHRAGRAEFSVYRHTSEAPLFVIVKCLPGTNRRGDFLLLSRGQILAGSKSLPELLALFRRRLSLVGSG
jgi:hypothetical protein